MSLIPSEKETVGTRTAPICKHCGTAAGGAAVLGAMVGSASYIAAPAAVRIALPKASPGIYLTLALGVTFPFNLAIGVPLFMWFAQFLAR